MYKSKLMRKSTKRPRSSLVRKGTSNLDTGFVDSVGTTLGFDTTGTLQHVNIVPQGASVSQRVGKKIRALSFQVRGVISGNSAASLNYAVMLFVWDKRPTGSLPLITDVLTSVNANAFVNDSNSGRFTILKRVHSTLIGNPTSVSGAVTVTAAMTKEFYVSLKNRSVCYKAAGTGAIGDVEEGALYVITVGSNVSGTTAAVGTFQYRFRYLDI